MITILSVEEAEDKDVQKPEEEETRDKDVKQRKSLRQ